jgi:hypothetical protein
MVGCLKKFGVRKDSLPLYPFCVSDIYLIMAVLDSRNMSQCTIKD